MQLGKRVGDQADVLLGMGQSVGDCVESYSFLKSARNWCGAFTEEEGEQGKR